MNIRKNMLFFVCITSILSGAARAGELSDFSQLLCVENRDNPEFALEYARETLGIKEALWQGRWLESAPGTWGGIQTKATNYLDNDGQSYPVHLTASLFSDETMENYDNCRVSAQIYSPEQEIALLIEKYELSNPTQRIEGEPTRLSLDGLDRRKYETFWTSAVLPGAEVSILALPINLKRNSEYFLFVIEVEYNP